MRMERKNMLRESRLAGSATTLALFSLGVLLLAGGLIFLCAAVEKPTRAPVALALLLAGAGLAVWSGYRWRQARLRSPDVLGDRIVDLAAAHDARLTLAKVISALDVTDEDAGAALAHLEAHGLCHAEHQGCKTVYLFPGLVQTQVVRRCSYCGSEFAVRKPLHKCPNCGGTLDVVKT
jgi:hypothetical protein